MSCLISKKVSGIVLWVSCVVLFLLGCVGDNGNPGSNSGSNNNGGEENIYKLRLMNEKKVTILDTVFYDDWSHCNPPCDSVKQVEGYLIDMDVWWFDGYEGCEKYGTIIHDLDWKGEINLDANEYRKGYFWYFYFGVDSLGIGYLFLETLTENNRSFIEGNIIGNATKISFLDNNSKLISTYFKNMPGCSKIHSKRNITMFINKDDIEQFERFFVLK